MFGLSGSIFLAITTVAVFFRYSGIPDEKFTWLSQGWLMRLNTMLYTARIDQIFHEEVFPFYLRVIRERKQRRYIAGHTR